MSLRYIGTITGTKGTCGRLTISGIPDGLKIKTKTPEVHLGFSERFTKHFKVSFLELNGSSALLELSEIKSKEAAGQLKRQAVFIDDSLIVEDGLSFYVDDLIGCKVIDIDTKQELGILKDVMLLPANDVWIVDTAKGELPVPYIDDVVKKCDVKNKFIEIKVIDGLLDLIESEKGQDESAD